MNETQPQTQARKQTERIMLNLAIRSRRAMPDLELKSRRIMLNLAIESGRIRTTSQYVVRSSPVAEKKRMQRSGGSWYGMGGRVVCRYLVRRARNWMQQARRSEMGYTPRNRRQVRQVRQATPSRKVVGSMSIPKNVECLISAADLP